MPAPFSRKGFTLVELLVVMSVIGILAGSALVSNFTGSQRTARDGRRRSDINTYRDAVESWANENNGVYPASGTAFNLDTGCTTLGGGAGLSPYLPTCPRDPGTVGTVYTYQSANNNLDYCVWASLERNNNCYAVCSNGR